jgi:hypothetical protein
MSLYDQGRRPDSGSGDGRIFKFIIGIVGFFVIIAFATNACSNQSNDVWDDSAISWDTSGAGSEQPNNTVPWDYRIVEGTVGDIIGSDMTILPDNDLLANDDNYATGDKVWTLQAMEADMTPNADGKASVSLTPWTTLKSYKTEQAAKDDIDKLKIRLKTEVDLVGVYKTSYQNQTRQFAVLTMPTGQQIKQPIDEKQYDKLKSLKKASVVLEEVHDFGNYDLAYTKFRGWAS